MVRLRSKIWVQAYLKRLELQSIAAYVTAHGDDHSGAILIKVMKMDGSAKLYQKTFDLQNNRNAWVKILDGLDAKIDTLLEKQKVNDPDLWVVEIESASGENFLDEF
tara:strand:- start:8814 stop:9134 length:321 start_codon:yes stop_codon:yes gene_type:complete